MENPGNFTSDQPKRFFDALYIRMLRETKVSLQCMCVQAMSVIYGKYFNEIGPFAEADYIVDLVGNLKIIFI